jgi:hypothetical protein
MSIFQEYKRLLLLGNISKDPSLFGFEFDQVGFARTSMFAIRASRVSQ